MKNNRVLDEFIELVKISSPSHSERKMADILKQKLCELGLEVREDNSGDKIGGSAGNVIGVLKGENGTPLMLCAHMDRVLNGDNIIPVIENGKIKSDGTTILAADDVSGIAAILGGIRLLQETKKQHGDVEIVFTIGEETGIYGSKFLDYTTIRAKHSYCFDSSGRIGRIINAAPSEANFVIDVYGKSAHAGSNPENGVNALKVAAKILAEIADGRLDFETTANWPVIKAGKVTNVVCDHVEIKGEARSRNPEKLNRYIEYVNRHCNEIVSKTDAKVGVHTEICYDSFRIEENDELLTILCEVMKNNGIEPLVEEGGGGMDANRFNEKGIKSVGVATGYLNNHSVCEELYIEDLTKSAQIVCELICAYADKS